MGVVDGDGNGWISGPNGPIQVERNGEITKEGRSYFFTSSMSFFRDNYMENNLFPETIDRLFDLYNQAWNFKLEGKSRKSIRLKLLESASLIDEISNGFYTRVNNVSKPDIKKRKEFLIFSEERLKYLLK